MMRSVNTEFPIAGIECELYFPPDYGTILNKKNQSWERLASDELYELLDDRVLGVTFHKRKNIRLAGQKEVSALFLFDSFLLYKMIITTDSM